MKLTELEPAWIGFHGGPSRCGISFRCPCKPACTERLHVMFDVSLEGVAAPPPHPSTNIPRWHREGSSFEDLTLTPSVDASAFGHWHGFITNGEIR